MPESQQPQRQNLPIPDRQHVGVTTYDAKDPATAFPPIEPLRPPEGAPNVLVILLDDAGSARRRRSADRVRRPTSSVSRRTGSGTTGSTRPLSVPRPGRRS